MKKVNSWRELTLREKIGQTVVSLGETDKHIEMCGSIEKFLEKYPIGGLFNNVGMVKGLMTGANTGFQDMLDEYNKYLRVPLFGTADHGYFADNNDASLPPQMALGAANDASLSYKSGEFKAQDYKKSAVHWGFWPVCDLSIAGEGSSGVRCTGSDPDICIEVVKEQLKAMKDNGVIATLKHYPGSSSKCTIDAHLAPYDDDVDMEEWWATNGKVYKALIEAGAPTIMTAHHNLVNYQTDLVDGEYPPATMSYDLVTKLLREELGFKGVVVTDALCMGGFTGTKSLENTIRSFLAGNDVLLWPAYEYIDEMEKRILSGEIDEAILDAAVERIWNLKAEYGVLDGVHLSSDKNVAYFKEISDEISEKCLTLINNKGNLPAKNAKNIYIVGVTPDDGQYKALCALKEEFEKYGCNVTMRRNAWTNDIEEAEKENDLIIFALCRTTHLPIGPLDFWGEEATSIWASNCADSDKVVIASFGTPYLHKYYKKSKLTYVNAYSCARSVIASFVKAVMGDVDFCGETSVKL